MLIMGDIVYVEGEDGVEISVPSIEFSVNWKLL